MKDRVIISQKYMAVNEKYNFKITGRGYGMTEQQILTAERNYKQLVSYIQNNGLKRYYLYVTAHFHIYR